MIILLSGPVYVLKSIKINSVDVHCKKKNEYRFIFTLYIFPSFCSLSSTQATHTYNIDIVKFYIHIYMHILKKTGKYYIQKHIYLRFNILTKLGRFQCWCIPIVTFSLPVWLQPFWKIPYYVNNILLFRPCYVFLLTNKCYGEVGYWFLFLPLIGERECYS